MVCRSWPGRPDPAGNGRQDVRHHVWLDGEDVDGVAGEHLQDGADRLLLGLVDGPLIAGCGV
jgi:hypothetical protein